MRLPWRFAGFMAAAFCGLAGCTAVRTVDLKVPDGVYYRLNLVDDSVRYGKELRYGADSTSWVDAMSRRSSLPHEYIRSVERVSARVNRHAPHKVLAEINRHGRRRLAIATLADGTRHLAVNLQIDEDTVRWSAFETGESYRLGTDLVAAIRFRDPAGGAVRGVVPAVLAGAAVGAVWGVADGDDPPGWFAFSAEEKAILLGLGLGAISMPLGAVIGSFGHVEYRFRSSRNVVPDPAPPSPQLPTSGLEEHRATETIQRSQNPSISSEHARYKQPTTR